MTTQQNVLPRLLSLAVHELRTPVTVVSGYLRMLLKEQGGPLTEKQRKMLEEADRSCSRLGALVAEMSEFGKLESKEVSLARQEFDLRALVAELANSMQEGLDRGVRLEVRGDDRAVVVNGDRARVAAALKALMQSALRERAEPGVVIVECAIVDGPPGWGRVAIGDETVVTSLAQPVEGSPPFDEWRGGLGLALPLARRVIEAHGGQLWSADGAQSRTACALRIPLRT
jgi:two-component system cell cycle sensor histidine kinase PleC